MAREVEGLVGGAVGGVEVRGAAGPAGEAVGDAVVRGAEELAGDSAVRGTEGLVGGADEDPVVPGAEVPVGDSAVQAEGLAGDAVAAPGARGAKGPAGGSAVRKAEGLAGDVDGDSVVRGAESAVGDPALQEAEGLAGVADEDPVVREAEKAVGGPAVQEEAAPAEDAVASPVTQGAPSPLPAPARNLLGVGVALPGPLDHAHGILHRVTGFPEWDGFPLRDALARRLGVPVVVDKDTNAAALGLAVAGEGGSFAYLHLGTGLGAGLVIGGGVHRGARTGAGEFGHQVIQLDGPPCDCGNRGCIEALCLAAVARGDLDEAARVLGTGAGNLVGLLDIDLVLLGGRTVAADPEPFVRGVAAVLDARARREGAREAAVPVRVAPGGARGVAEGAAQLLLGPLFGRADG
ncbi:ROK family protein [Streptomyces sp. NBC_01239]|uniref:ROK family protein n=1 Tax=Streptomyces sp. NBC_01239 TaxID=2903792 RepID=UPI00224DA9FC|nr:ROK family protein [Streptomyces sp. NBC_01239]MCX4811325.1 ROK family protein [Streptomyces sp. NBC_01239]